MEKKMYNNSRKMEPNRIVHVPHTFPRLFYQTPYIHANLMVYIHITLVDGI